MFQGSELPVGRSEDGRRLRGWEEREGPRLEGDLSCRRPGRAGFGEWELEGWGESGMFELQIHSQRAAGSGRASATSGCGPGWGAQVESGCRILEGLRAEHWMSG